MKGRHERIQPGEISPIPPINLNSRYSHAFLFLFKWKGREGKGYTVDTFSTQKNYEFIAIYHCLLAGF
jgi:hypothetical protein